ncbi:MAG: biotin--[acetyl-CoA-carboxylase] ligase [Bacteroidales bacterium]|nr:biotin--[acetyl-CoA-carboxylase] ligase [Candidatus Hennigimonas equi]
MINPPIYNILFREKVGSTNSELRSIMDGQPDFTVLTCDWQEAGRGQGGHSWHSRKGANLIFSILTRYEGEKVLEASEQQLITMASSLAVTDFLSDFGVDAGIKKPNDIYAGGRKICGMLIENGICGSCMRWSIIGMGININETDFPEDLPNPVSLVQLVPGRYELKKCLRAFLKHFSIRFDAIWASPEDLEMDYGRKLI